jgi:hypothetical protein
LIPRCEPIPIPTRCTTLQAALGAQRDAVNTCAELRKHATGSPHTFLLGELTATAYMHAADGRDSWRPLWVAARHRYKRAAL